MCKVLGKVKVHLHLDIQKISMTFEKVHPCPLIFKGLLHFGNFKTPLQEDHWEENTGIYRFHWIFAHSVFQVIVTFMLFSLWNLPQR